MKNDIFKNSKAQALTEFVFIVPLLFLIFLFIVQFTIMIEKDLNTQKSVWFALRGTTGYGSNSDGTVKNWIRHDFFSRDDKVDVEYKKYGLLKIAEVKCGTPYLFRGINWILPAFKGVVRNNRIELKSKGTLVEVSLPW